MSRRSEKVKQVHDILLDMKDTSELMVDLAYSSVFYGSRDLARQVLELENEVGTEFNQVHRLILEAVRDDELPVDHGQVLTRVAWTAENLANAALEIADVVLRDVGLHPILKAAISSSDSATTQVIVSPDSEIVDRSLAESELEIMTGMRVLAVKRGGRWRTGVSGRFQLRADDLLIAVGPESAVDDFQALAAPDSDGSSEPDEGSN